MFCWELGLQRRRDVLPALVATGVKLFAVGIGSQESALEFADRLEFPAELMLADTSEEADAYAAVGTRNTQRDATGKQIFEGVESMWSQRTNDAIKARGRDDLNEITGSLFNPGPYKPLMPTGPKAMERTFVQGGAFVFEGSKELYGHYDFSSGDHADLDEVVRVALSR